MSQKKANLPKKDFSFIFKNLKIKRTFTYKFYNQKKETKRTK